MRVVGRLVVDGEAGDTRVRCSRGGENGVVDVVFGSIPAENTELVVRFDTWPASRGVDAACRRRAVLTSSSDAGDIAFFSGDGAALRARRVIFDNEPRPEARFFPLNGGAVWTRASALSDSSLHELARTDSDKAALLVTV